MTRRVPLAIVGAGRVGRALTRALLAAGWPVTALVSRRRRPALSRELGIPVGPWEPSPRPTGAWLLAVPAGALEEVAGRLAAALPRGRRPVVLHTNGGAPDDSLAALRAAGAAVGRLHPLLPFPGRALDASFLRGASFALSGSRRAQALGRRIVLALGGRPLRLPDGGEAGYHVSAVLAANLLVALAGGAAALGPTWGVSRRRALGALLPLMRATLAALEDPGLPGALTGPLARGEVDAVARQLDWLEQRGEEELAEVYRALGRLAIGLAREQGTLSATQEDRMRRRLLRRRRPPRTP